jgi:hypothetical protein
VPFASWLGAAQTSRWSPQNSDEGSEDKLSPKADLRPLKSRAVAGKGQIILDGHGDLGVSKPGDGEIREGGKRAGLD